MTIFCDREFNQLMYYKDGDEFGSYHGSELKEKGGKIKAKTPERKKEISDLYYSGDRIRFISKEEAEEIIKKYK